MAGNRDGKRPRRKARTDRKSTAAISAMQTEWFCEGKIIELVPAAACPSGVQIRPEDDGDAATGVLDARP
jgi:hypothetical protein